MGALTAVGNSVADTWEALVAGRSGVAEITGWDASHMPIRIGAEVKGFDPADWMPVKEARRIARCSQLVLAMGVQAMADAGLGEQVPDPEHSAVILGVALGGLDLTLSSWHTYLDRGLRRVNPFHATNSLVNMPAHHVSLRFQCLGHNGTIVTACASGTQAIGESAELIRNGRADLVLTGGVDGLVSELILGGFTAMRVLACDNESPEKACKPFDARRDGFVTGEGGAVMVLEPLEKALARGARIHAEVLGWAANSDAFHVAAPDPEGAGAKRCMQWALEDAGVTIDEIDYINAHGPGTIVGDPTETKAIKTMFGERAYQVPVSSTKSMVGHTLGGAGAIEALACVQSIKTGIIHPTINLEEPDPACDLDYVPLQARQAEVRTTLSNSFGLGGQNACLVLRRYEN
jgi:beta-ketoacyl-acyl-carrier-protein synthase II